MKITDNFPPEAKCKITWFQACEILLLIKNKNPSSQTFDPCALVSMAMARVGDPLHIYMYSVSSKGPFWPYLGSRLPSIHCAFAQRVRSCFLESLDIGFSPPAIWRSLGIQFFYGQMAKNDSPDEDRVGGRSQTNVVKSRILRAIRVTFEFIRIAGEEEFSLE